MTSGTKVFTICAAAMAMAVAGAVPAAGQDTQRQGGKNTLRNLGIGLGAAAVIEAIRGHNTNALLLGAGAAYAGKEYEDTRRSQRRDNARRRYYRGRDTRPIQVVLNDETVRFPDEKPEMMGGRTYVPLRGVLEKMGAYVRWDAREKAVVAVHGSKEVRLPVNGEATVNGRKIALDTPAYIDDGRTMVPLRFMAEAFGADVTWDPGDRRVHIDSTTRASTSE